MESLSWARNNASYLSFAFINSKQVAGMAVMSNASSILPSLSSLDWDMNWSNTFHSWYDNNTLSFGWACLNNCELQWVAIQSIRRSIRITYHSENIWLDFRISIYLFLLVLSISQCQRRRVKNACSLVNTRQINLSLAELIIYWTSRPYEASLSHR